MVVDKKVGLCKFKTNIVTVKRCVDRYGYGYSFAAGKADFHTCLISALYLCQSRPVQQMKQVLRLLL